MCCQCVSASWTCKSARKLWLHIWLQLLLFLHAAPDKTIRFTAQLTTGSRYQATGFYSSFEWLVAVWDNFLKFWIDFTRLQLIWPCSAPVVCCLGYKALQYGIIVLYYFASMQRRSLGGWRKMEALYCMFPNKNYFSLAALLGLCKILAKTKVFTCCFAYGSVLLLRGAGRVALTETYFIRSLMSATCSLGLVSSCLCWLSGSNYLCKADFV